MSTELATTQKREPILATSRGVQLSSMEDMYRFATCVVNSGLAPKGFTTPEAVVVAVQRGSELGMSPMHALESIAVINGRSVLWGDAPLALCEARLDFEDIEEIVSGEGDARVATCTVKRRGRTPTVRQFSVQDAKDAGLWKKSGPWTQYASRMLQLRARGFALRDAFPDALKGVGIAEEVRDIEPKQANAREIPAAVIPEEPTVRLDAPEVQIADTGTAELWEADK